MNYPVWYVPVIGSGWVIGIIAIIHVYISHFAVGGGIFLPIAEAKALKEGRADWLARLRGYSKFFLILTGVVGVVTGVGIWFAISLTSPEGTSSLIRNFVFAWAMEWVVFMVELSLAAVYYYTWNRVPDSVHLKIGYLYGGISYITLVIINGILTFMLTPGGDWLGVAGSGQESSMFFQAFFNPTYWPSLGLRTLVCLSLAGIFALVFFSRLDGAKEGDLKRDMIRWAAKWLWPAYLLMPFFFAWYLWMVPEGHRVLLTLGFSTIGAGTFSLVTRMALVTLIATATLMGVVYFLAHFSPRDFRLGHALGIFFLGFIAMGSAESTREMLRKPYVISEYMYSNGVRPSQVEGFNRDGFTTHSLWSPSVANLDPNDSIKRGHRMFLGECLPCHTLDGYRGMTTLLRGRDEKAIGSLLEILHEHKGDSPYCKFMPPLAGTPEEIAALRVYLNSVVNGQTLPKTEFQISSISTK
jgi:cytochrome bd-type quinol oxidase subunit 1